MTLLGDAWNRAIERGDAIDREDFGEMLAEVGVPFLPGEDVHVLHAVMAMARTHPLQGQAAMATFLVGLCVGADVARTNAPTWWDGAPCQARRVNVIVGESSAPAYWARQFVGDARRAVEVIHEGGVLYLDDEALSDELVQHFGGVCIRTPAGWDGMGWAKVTGQPDVTVGMPFRRLNITTIIGAA